MAHFESMLLDVNKYCLRLKIESMRLAVNKYCLELENLSRVKNPGEVMLLDANKFFPFIENC